MPFISASVSVVHHLCLEGKSVGAGCDKLLDTERAGKGLLAYIYFFPPDSVSGEPANMIICTHWQFLFISYAKVFFNDT